MYTVMITPVKNTRIKFDIRTYRNHRREEPETKTKLAIATGSAVGTLVPLIVFAKKQKKNIFKIDYGLKEMLTVGLGSIIGAVATGLAVDKKERRKQKINEGVFQFMNASVPTFITGGLFSLDKKFEACKKPIYKIGASIVGIVGGMQLAAYLSNKINDPYDKVPDRKLTLKDSIANFDDAFGVLVLAKVPLAEKLQAEKILPIIYGWCGYRAGMSN